MRSRNRPLLKQAIPMLNALAFSPQSFVQSGAGTAFVGIKCRLTTWLWRKLNACDCLKLRFKSSANTNMAIHRPSYSTPCRHSCQNTSYSREPETILKASFCVQRAADKHDTENAMIFTKNLLRRTRRLHAASLIERPSAQPYLPIQQALASSKLNSLKPAHDC